MAVILNLDAGMLLLDVPREFGEEGRAADSGHVLETDFVSSVRHELLHHSEVVFHGVDGGVGDGERRLRNHSRLLGVFYREFEVAVVVEAAERPCYVGTLGFLHLEHEFAHVGRNRIHAQGVESSFEHVGLDADLVEGGGPLAHGDVGVLSVEEVHLFERSAIGLDAVKTAHVDDGGCDSDELVNPRLIFARGLPHVPVDKGEFYFFCHSQLKFFRKSYKDSIKL